MKTGLASAKNALFLSEKRGWALCSPGNGFTLRPSTCSQTLVGVTRSCRQDSPEKGRISGHTLRVEEDSERTGARSTAREPRREPPGPRLGLSEPHRSVPGDGPRCSKRPRTHAFGTPAWARSQVTRHMEETGRLVSATRRRLKRAAETARVQRRHQGASAATAATRSPTEPSPRSLRLFIPRGAGASAMEDASDAALTEQPRLVRPVTDALASAPEGCPEQGPRLHDHLKKE